MKWYVAVRKAQEV